ncbi:hypothetical protein V3C99_012149, partial [Haemonchus contortus]
LVFHEVGTLHYDRYRVKSRARVLTMTGGRLFRCSALILSGPGAVPFLIDVMACRISEGRTEGTPKMAGRHVDVAVEEIRVEVVDDLLHCPSGCSNCSVRTTKGSHLSLVIGEIPPGFANALSGLGGFVHNCCSSLSQIFLYRFSA